MKKTILSFMLAVICCLSVTAQNSSDEPVKGFAVVYQTTFEKDHSFGFGATIINPNFIGFEIESLFSINSGKFTGGGVDVGPNYAFELPTAGDIRLFLTASLGPTIYYSQKVDDEGKETSKMKFNFGAYGDAKFVVNYKRFMISAGYIYRAPEFKFSKNKGASGGLIVSVAYDF